MAASSRVAGERISALSGLYVHFLLQSLAWMAPGGAGVWLIPSEFMDVNYGRALRRVLLSQVTLIRVHRADPTALAFDDALVSSAVVVLRQGPPPAGHRVHMSFGGSLAAPDRAAWVPVERLAGAPKWTRFPEDADATAAPATAATLGDLFSIKRGVVTGANDFFIVSEADAARLDLPREFLTPILPGPRGVPTDEVLPRGDGLPALDPVLFLVDCGLAPDRVRERAPSLWRYLSGGEGALAGRYLCSRRRPWYAQEQRPPAPILCTYMGRGSSTRRRPFRFLRNRTAAIGANVYLNLYPRVPWSPERLDGLWAWLNALPPEALARVGRVYGGGLYKLEPAELAELPLPSSLVR